MSSPQTSPAPGPPPDPSQRAVPVVGPVLLIGVLVLMLAFGRISRRDPGLTEKQARYLQDVEHLGGFVLGDLCLPKLAKAIAEDDADGLSAAFTEIAGAWIPPRIDRMVSRQHGAVTVTSWQRIEQKREEVGDGEDLVTWLRDQRHRFASIDAVRLKVKRMPPDTAGRRAGVQRQQQRGERLDDPAAARAGLGLGGHVVRTAAALRDDGVEGLCR